MYPCMLPCTFDMCIGVYVMSLYLSTLCFVIYKDARYYQTVLKALQKYLADLTHLAHCMLARFFRIIFLGGVWSR